MILMTDASDLQSYLVESINVAATVKSLNAESKILKSYEKYQM